MPLTPKRIFRFRQFRYAMYFDGVDDYVVNTGFGWKILQNGFTIAMWLNVADKYSDVIRHFSASQGYLDIDYRMDFKSLGFASRSTNTNELLAVYQSVGKNPPNIFNNGVFTWDTAQGCWFVNGVFDKCVSDSRTGKGMAYTGYYIGMKLYKDWYQGYISQLLIYSRVLSNSEILWNYNYPDNPVRNGLVLWLKADPNYVKDIDGDGILEWIDLSGYNNHGKIYGARLVQLIKTHNRTLMPVRVLTPVR